MPMYAACPPKGMERPLLLAVAVVDREVRIEKAAPEEVDAEAGVLPVRMSYRFEESSRRREGHRFRFWVRLDDEDPMEVERRFDDTPMVRDGSYGDLTFEVEAAPGIHTLRFGASVERLLHDRSGFRVAEEESRQVQGRLTVRA